MPTAAKSSVIVAMRAFSRDVGRSFARLVAPSAAAARAGTPTRDPLPVLALVAMCVLDHAAMSGARVALALQALQGLGLPAGGAGLLLAPFALTSTLCALALGRWIDRVGARGPALAGIGLEATGLALAAWHPGVAALAVTATAVGLGYAAALIALQAELARDRTETQRRAAFTAFAAGAAVSSGLGPFLAGQAMAHGGARTAFGVLAALAATSWLAAFASRGRMSARPRAEADPAAPEAAPAATSSGFGALRCARALRRVLATELLFSLAWNGNSFAIPLLGRREGWTPDVVGDLLATFGVAVLLVRAIPAARRGRGGDWLVVRRALAASGAAIALLPLAAAMPWPWALEFALGCGLGGALPSVLAIAHARTPAGRAAEVLGLRQSVQGLGAAVLPGALGVLVAAAGLGAALVGLGATLLAAASAIAPRDDQPRAGP
ncbi:MAG: MFS transporter [Burkholderiaceae bacterium]